MMINFLFGMNLETTILSLLQHQILHDPPLLFCRAIHSYFDILTLVLVILREVADNLDFHGITNALDQYVHSDKIEGK